MEAFASYLMKSVIWLTGFAIVYFIFLRNERYFMLKRIYLASGILISMIFPLISIHYQVEIPAQVLSQADISGAGGASIPAVQQNISGKSFDYRLILLFLYLSGITILLVRSIQHFSSIFKTINKANINELGPAKLIRASQFPASFSFFNYVFINPSVSENEVEEIMNHEIVHVRQKHWFDLLLVEILRLIQWVNPFAWIYTRFIRLNHEYLADQAALQRTASPANYRAALLNQLFESPVISLSNPFNYSLNKKRFDMMKKIITSPYRKLKVLLVLPIFAIVFYAFATPEYHYSSPGNTIKEAASATIDIPAPIQSLQEEKNTIPEKGTPQDTSKASLKIRNVLGDTHNTLIIIDGVQRDRKKLDGINPNSIATVTILKDESATALYGEKGKNGVILITTKNSAGAPARLVNMEPKAIIPPVTQQDKPSKVIFIDGVYSDKTFAQINAELGHNWGMINPFSAKEGLEKYGELGKNGGYDITTRKKALEMGFKPPYPRISSEDYPTFQGKARGAFIDWVISQVKYPAEATAKGIHGLVHSEYTIETDGTVSNVKYTGTPDPLLGDALVKAIQSSPKWELPKNPEANEPYKSILTIKFELPDKVLFETEPFVVVEQMPMYPGGDAALLTFIGDNTHYPDSAKAKKIQGRVIVRFVVTTEGKTDEIAVLKGVHPLLDAEAMRVASMLSGFTPGYQGGKAVPVWYMIPITFTLK
jgi:TonB family protein